MTIGTPVKIKDYNVHAVVTKSTSDGVTIRDAKESHAGTNENHKD